MSILNSFWKSLSIAWLTAHSFVVFADFWALTCFVPSFLPVLPCGEVRSHGWVISLLGEARRRCLQIYPKNWKVRASFECFAVILGFLVARGSEFHPESSCGLLTLWPITIWHVLPNCTFGLQTRPILVFSEPDLLDLAYFESLFAILEFKPTFEILERKGTLLACQILKISPIFSLWWDTCVPIFFQDFQELTS